jgi:Zinc carboxypeptidase
MMSFIFFRLVVVYVVVLFQVFLVAGVAVTTTTTTSSTAYTASTLPIVDENKLSFPGIYSLWITRREQQQQQQQQQQNKEEWAVGDNESVWVQMDVIQVDCEGVEKDHLCHVQTLIQSFEEYHFLQSKLINVMMTKTKEQSPEQKQEEEEEDASVDSSLFVLQYNATLSQRYIEPRLAIQRQFLFDPTENSINSTTSLYPPPSPHRPRFLNSEGYSHIATRDCFLDYQGMMAWIQDFIQQANATGLLQVEWKDVGDSYLKTVDSQQGNDIHVLTVTGRRHRNITNNNNNQTRTTTVPTDPAPFVLLSSMHPREYAPPELVRRFLLHILQYVQKWNHLPPYLETTQIHWFPYVNVDGRQSAETTEPWRRKNLNKDWNDSSDTCSNDAYGVDLNRNFPFQWGVDGGSSADACSPLSRGTGPASEPETQAVIQYAKQLFPPSQQQQAFTIQSTVDPPLDLPNTNNNNQWRGYNETTTIGVFVDIHSFGQCRF